MRSKRPCTQPKTEAQRNKIRAQARQAEALYAYLMKAPYVHVTTSTRATLMTKRQLIDGPCPMDYTTWAEVIQDNDEDLKEYMSLVLKQKKKLQDEINDIRVAIKAISKA